MVSGEQGVWSETVPRFDPDAGALFGSGRRLLPKFAPPTAYRRGPVYERIVLDLIVAWDMISLPLTSATAAQAVGFVIPGVSLNRSWLPAQLSLAIVAGLLAPFVLNRGVLRDGDRFPRHDVIIAGRVAALFGLVLTIAWMTDRLQGVPAVWIGLWWLLATAAAIAGRAALSHHILSLKRRRLLGKRVAIVGAGPDAERVHDELTRGCDTAVAGIFDDTAVAGDGFGRVDGTVQDLIEMAQAAALDRILIVTSPSRERELAGLLHRLLALDADILAHLPGVLTARSAGGATGLEPACLPLARRPIQGWGLVAKTAGDRFMAIALLTLCAPVIALAAFAVRLDSPGPIVFRQCRHGRNNTKFHVLKFRTMTWQGAGLASGAAQTRRDDPRITRVGKFLRKSSIDELPQLLNVLAGQMSIVGPRPHPVAMRTQGRLCSEIVPAYAHRHRVKPGLTGWAQVNGCRGAAELPEHVRRRIAFDISYVDNWSLLFDLKIIALTPWHLLVCSANAF